MADLDGLRDHLDDALRDLVRAAGGRPAHGRARRRRPPARAAGARPPGRRRAHAGLARPRRSRSARTHRMRIALVQMNAVVGDIAGNEALVRARLHEARAAGAQLVLFPELALSGYPPEDLLLKEHFLRDARAALDRVAAEVPGRRGGRRVPRARRRRLQQRGGARRRRGAGDLPQDPPAELRRLRRGAVLPAGPRPGARRGRRREGRPDRVRGHLAARAAAERRGAGRRPAHREHRRVALPPRARGTTASGWSPSAPATSCARWPSARSSAARTSSSSTATRSSSTTTAGSSPARPSSRRRCSSATSTPTPPARPGCATPAAGARPARRRPPSTTSGRCARRRPGRTRARSAARSPTRCRRSTRSTPRSSWGRATTTRKNGFGHVVLGLSGGIDSTLVALIAVDALGAEAVTCVTMPSRYTSEGTLTDAKALAAQPRRGAPRAPHRRGRWRPTRSCCATSSPAASPT